MFCFCIFPWRNLKILHNYVCLLYSYKSIKYNELTKVENRYFSLAEALASNSRRYFQVSGFNDCVRDLCRNDLYQKIKKLSHCHVPMPIDLLSLLLRGEILQELVYITYSCWKYFPVAFKRTFFIVINIKFPLLWIHYLLDIGFFRKSLILKTYINRHSPKKVC